MNRRDLVCAGALLPIASAWSQPDPWTQVLPGRIVLMRHAMAPGIGDPPGFKLNNCASQRNLDEVGKDQARRIGAAFAQHAAKSGVKVTSVWHSQWCRTTDTAQLAFGNAPKPVAQSAFNSFFGNADAAPQQTAAARKLLMAWVASKPVGVLVVVTHQVNITALTQMGAASGESVIVAAAGQKLIVVGQLPP